MNNRTFVTLLAPSLLTLAACSQQQISLQDHLGNPLFAERYSDEIVQSIVSLEINKDPSVTDPAMQTQIDTVKQQWLDRSRAAVLEEHRGFVGQFTSSDQSSQGRALLLDTSLYFDTTFVVTPGADVHVYLSPTIDPRDVKFPDPSSLDIGPLQSAYGDQQYAVRATGEHISYRSVVLWDRTLKRIVAFAQIN